MIEAMLAVVIAGTAFMAVLQLIAAGTLANAGASRLTTGVNLARNIREIALQRPYADLTDLHGATYSPPRDSRNLALTDMSDWEQSISVRAVDPNELTLNITDTTPSAVRITVTVRRSGEKVCDLSWYAFDGSP